MHKKMKLVIGIAVIFLGVIAFAAYTATKEKASLTPQSPDLPVESLVGKVTRINRNGLDYIIDEHGHKAAGPEYGLTDGGDLIVVDGQTFITSNGNSAVEDSLYINIKSIHLGDEVIVNYAVNESGGKTLDCRDCSVEERISSSDGKPTDKKPQY